MYSDLIYKKYKTIDLLYTFQYEEKDISLAIKRLLCSLHSVKNQNCNIIIVNGSKTCIKEYLKGFNVTYIHKHEKQLGAKCKLINYGVKKLVKTDYFLLSDIDLVYPSDYVEYTNEKYISDKTKTWRVIFYNYNLLEFCYEKDINVFLRKKIKKDPDGGFAHGNGLIHRKSFLRINGYDEDFIGYGPEDDMFNIRIKKINDWVYDKEMYSVHMFHKRTNLIQVDKNHEMFLKRKTSLESGSNKYLIANKGGI